MALYGNIVDWRVYASARGNTAPDEALDADATAALQRASDYIRLRYVRRYGLDETSADVVEASYIAASYELATSGFWSTTFTPTEIKTLTRLDVMGWTPARPGTANYRGADSMTPVHPQIEALLAPGEGAMGPYLWAVGNND